MHDGTILKNEEITPVPNPTPDVPPKPEPGIVIKAGVMTDLHAGSVVVLAWQKAGTRDLLLSPIFYKVQRIDPKGKVILKVVKRA